MISEKLRTFTENLLVFGSKLAILVYFIFSTERDFYFDFKTSSLASLVNTVAPLQIIFAL